MGRALLRVVIERKVVRLQQRLHVREAAIDDSTCMGIRDKNGGLLCERAGSSSCGRVGCPHAAAFVEELRGGTATSVDTQENRCVAVDSSVVGGGSLVVNQSVVLFSFLSLARSHRYWTAEAANSSPLVTRIGRTAASFAPHTT